MQGGWHPDYKMADFDDNPFADPGAQGGINPFADPAVTQATSSGTNGANGATEDYNPFAEEAKKEPEAPRLPPPPTKAQVKSKEKSKDKSKSKPKAPERPPETAPAIMLPDDPPPSYEPAPAAFSDPHQDELAKKEAEIAEREQALRERERNMERLGGVERPNNFPPFPKFCPSPLKPCFYINIKVEVPPSQQWKVFCMLGILIYTWVLHFLNLLISILGVSTIGDKGNKSEYLTTMGVAILYLVLFIPGSFCCWFFPLYHAYKRDSSLSFMFFFFVMLFQILAYVVNGIGIPNLGACGFFNGARFFDTGNSGSQEATGALYMIMGLLWFIGAPCAIIMIVLIHQYYRSSGHTINEAVEEGMAGAARNKHVRSAVKSGVKTGVKTAFDK